TLIEFRRGRLAGDDFVVSNESITIEDEVEAALCGPAAPVTARAVALQDTATRLGDERLPAVSGQGGEQPQRGQPVGSHRHVRSPGAEASLLSQVQSCS